MLVAEHFDYPHMGSAMNTNPKTYVMRKVFLIDQELSDQLDQFRFSQRFRKESDVLRLCLKAGLEVLTHQPTEAKQ